MRDRYCILLVGKIRTGFPGKLDPVFTGLRFQAFHRCQLGFKIYIHVLEALQQFQGAAAG